MPKASSLNTRTLTKFRPMDHDRMMAIIDSERFADLEHVVSNVVCLLCQSRKDLKEIAVGYTYDDIREARVGLEELLRYVELVEHRCREVSRAA
jgi:hypothetical protein